LTANIIDVVVEHRPLGRLWINAAVLALVLLQNIPMHILWVRLSSGVIRSVGADLRSGLANHLQQLSIGFHSRAGASMVQTKVVRDVENVESMLQQVAQAGTSATFTLVGALTLTAIRVPEFVPLFLLVVPCSAAIVAVVRRRSATRNEQFRRRVEQLNARVGEMATLMPITRAHGLEREALHRMQGTVREVSSTGLRLDMINGRLGAFSWVTYQMLGAACLVGAAAAARTGVFPVSAGDVVLLSSYFALLTSAAVMLFGLAPIITKGTESIRSIGEVLEDPDVEHNEGKLVVDRIGGAITLQDVSFAYPDAGNDSAHATATNTTAANTTAANSGSATSAGGSDGDAPALRGISLDVRPGETIAFVGPSGAGKSTLLNLLLGFLRPSAGQILLDGVPMEEIDLRSYRRFLSVVPQESLLFDGTVYDNVTYGMTGVDPATVRTALADANALEFVSALPNGWDTVVGERGARLSGGQRQRLAIARALVRDPRVLLLDEATSALDSQSEALIQGALARLMHGRTTFVVAHRLSTIRGADRVVVLARGEVVEVGPHDELLRHDGLYRRLHTAQAA
ncbi:MAG TPA: ABC transporter ATP-binding protein, partial [Rugosimonospora sp.]|nr:ABC transporter ATP-binding protein [Rugosimonospora sp.]